MPPDRQARRIHRGSILSGPLGYGKLGRSIAGCAYRTSATTACSRPQKPGSSGTSASHGTSFSISLGLTCNDPNRPPGGINCLTGLPLVSRSACPLHAQCLNAFIVRFRATPPRRSTAEMGSIADWRERRGYRTGRLRRPRRGNCQMGCSQTSCETNVIQVWPIIPVQCATRL
ncbi:MAG: hypothetical protein JWQ22_3086 [Devosia sp.]|nr:hypothetical protein [Devosia sp.]